MYPSEEKSYWGEILLKVPLAILIGMAIIQMVNGGFAAIGNALGKISAQDAIGLSIEWLLLMILIAVLWREPNGV